MKSLLKIFLLLTASTFIPAIMQAQVTVTGTITDTVSTPYANGTLAIQLVDANGNPPGQLTTFGGSPNFQRAYQLSLDSTGSFSITIPPNSTTSPSIIPTDRKWKFTYASRGGYGAATVSIAITGAGDISGTLSGLTRISWPSSILGPPCGTGQVVISIGNGLNACGSASGGGTTTNQVVNGIPLNTNGTATAINSIICTPPIVNGQYPILYNITSGSTVPPTCPLLGLVPDQAAGANVLYRDNGGILYNPNINLALPTPTTLGTPNSYAIIAPNMGSSVSL